MIRDRVVVERMHLRQRDLDILLRKQWDSRPGLDLVHGYGHLEYAFRSLKATKNSRTHLEEHLNVRSIFIPVRLALNRDPGHDVQFLRAVDSGRVA